MTDVPEVTSTSWYLIDDEPELMTSTVTVLPAPGSQ